MKVNLERLLGWISILFLAVILSLIAISLTQDHSIKNYYLNENENKLQIGMDINWSPDSHIDLDRTVTYDEAVLLVEKLNNNLNKNK